MADQANTRNVPVMQAGVSTESFLREMEFMSIQAMDLEVEISELRIELAKLKRNAWELDQIVLSKGRTHWEWVLVDLVVWLQPALSAKTGGFANRHKITPQNFLLVSQT